MEENLYSLKGLCRQNFYNVISSSFGHWARGDRWYRPKQILKCKFFYYSEFFEGTLPLKTGYRNRKWLSKHGYRNKKWLWKLVTGTESGHQIWLPEQNLVIKYGYRNRKWSSNMVTGTKSVHQIWLPKQIYYSCHIYSNWGMGFKYSSNFNILWQCTKVYLFRKPF